MKNFKAIIIIILLFTSFISTPRQQGLKTSLFANIIAPDLPGKTESSVPARLTPKSYQQLRDDIQKMKSSDVINPDGTLTVGFITFIIDNAKRSHLDPLFIEALLQTGMSFHFSFNADNATVLEAITNNQQEIATIIDWFNYKAIPTPTFLPQPINKPIPSPLPEVQPKPSIIEPTLPTPKIPSLEPINRPKTSQQEPIVTQPKPIATKNEPQGIIALHNFRFQTLAGPIDNFYAQGTVNKQWLATALNLVLNGAALTSLNKSAMQGEMIGTATELMSQLLQQNKISTQDRSKLLNEIKNQVITFMNEQPLADESPIKKTSITHKTPALQPAIPQQKRPQAEPTAKESNPPSLKLWRTEPMVLQTRPNWISDNNTVLNKEFEIEVLNYIFKHEEATKANTLTYFTNQLSAALRNNENILNSMKTIIKKIFPEPEKPVAVAEQPKKPQKPEIALESPSIQTIPTKSSQKLPSWINKTNAIINVPQLKNEILTYFAAHTNADNQQIAHHFINQIPQSHPKKPTFERQIKLIIEKTLPE